MKMITLTKGYITVVDDDQYERLSQYLWHVQICKNKNDKISVVYAVRFTPFAEGHEYIYMHRDIMGVTDKSLLVDHEDHNGLHNCVDNLRVCNKGQNVCNQRLSTKNTSGYKGVTWEKGKWMAQIGYKGKHYNLGRFDNSEEGKLLASKAYEEAAARLHAGFACFDKNGTSTEEGN